MNDDVTPMEFVVYVIEHVFVMDRDSATRLMLRIHNEGVAACGAYSQELAKTKVDQVTELAREHRHALKCVIELRTKG